MPSKAAMPFFLASARMDHDSHGDLPASLSFSTHQQHIASKAHWPAVLRSPLHQEDKVREGSPEHVSP